MQKTPAERVIDMIETEASSLNKATAQIENLCNEVGRDLSLACCDLDALLGRTTGVLDCKVLSQAVKQGLNTDLVETIEAVIKCLDEALTKVNGL